MHTPEEQDDQMIEHAYQRHTIDYWKALFDIGCVGSYAFADPGMGKTYMALSLIDEMRQERGDVRRVMVIAPLSVAEMTWPDEIANWGFDWEPSFCCGARAKREHVIRNPTDLILVNPENVPWLAPKLPLTAWQLSFLKSIDLLIVDESTKFKNWSASRSWAMRRICKHVKKRVILTGTPAPKSCHDLHSQMYIVDNGESLGVDAATFHARYSRPGGWQNRQSVPDKDAAERIQKAIAPLGVRLDAESYLEMPELIEHDVEVRLRGKARDAYEEMEAELFALLESGESLTATNAGAKYNLCRQIANGGGYCVDEDTNERRTVEVHNAKTDALQELVDELHGKPLFVATQFRHDVPRIRARFGELTPAITSGMKADERRRVIEDWNAGKIPLLLAQTQCVSHGLNMQRGGLDIAWFGLTDNSEDYGQFNRRIFRQGVRGTVRIHRIIARRTVDEVMRLRLADKLRTQQELLDALRDYRIAKEKGSLRK